MAKEGRKEGGAQREKSQAKKEQCSESNEQLSLFQAETPHPPPLLPVLKVLLLTIQVCGAGLDGLPKLGLTCFHPHLAFPSYLAEFLFIPSHPTPLSHFTDRLVWSPFPDSSSLVFTSAIPPASSPFSRPSRVSAACSLVGHPIRRPPPARSLSDPLPMPLPSLVRCHLSHF